MADGGSFMDGWRETARGFGRATRALPRVLRRLKYHLTHYPALHPEALARHIWRAGHDDQRLSWFSHWLICLAATLAGGGPAGVFVGGGLWTAWGVSFVMWLIYMYREAGDQRYHQDDVHDWDEFDHDTDWQGKPVEGVTPRFDRIGDLTGPTFNCGNWFAAALLQWSFQWM